MLKIAICDDNSLEAGELSKIIKNYLSINTLNAQIEIFRNGSELLKKVKQFELIILDIVLAHELGTNLAKKVHFNNSDAQILFYSSNLDYAPDVFEAYGNGFITKPLNIKKIYMCLDRVFKQIKRQIITFKEVENNLEVSINENDIEYIESSRKYSIIHVKNMEFKCTQTLKCWEEKLEKEQFYLCKRGLLINMHHIDFVDKFGNLVLNSGEKIALSAVAGKRIKEELLRYWSDNL